MTQEQRAQVVQTAQQWMRTPYHHMGRIKGVGADCAMFPLAVYQECGIVSADFRVPKYSMQWHLHQTEEKYLQTIEPLVQEKQGEPLPGDFVVFKFGRAFSHGAIVVEWPLIIHSYIPHGVQYADALRDGELIGREMKVFEVKA